MKYAILISTRRDLGLLSDLTGELFRRGLFPDLLSSEVLGSTTVRVRLELDCDELSISSLAVFLEKTLGIEMAVVTPCSPPSIHTDKPVSRPTVRTTHL